MGTIRQVLEDAVRDAVLVSLRYEDGSGRRTHRLVEAHGLLVTRQGEYLIGWCLLRHDRRVFRIDRIHAVTATEEPIGRRDIGPLLTGELLDPRGDTVGEIEHATQRIALVTSAVQAAVRRDELLPPGAESVRSVLAHLCAWTRWELTRLRGAGAAEDPHDEPALQRSLAGRSLAQLSADLRRTLQALARWVRGQPDDVVSDLAAVLDHLDWHLDHLDDLGHLVRRRGRVEVARCPLIRVR